MLLVERLRQVELRALRVGGQLRVAQEPDHLVGRRLEGVERRALVFGGQEARRS